MGHDKLRKFAENETFSCLLQPTAEQVLSKGYANLTDHPVKGNWIGQMFGGHEGDIILELGCGKGEYTLELARRNPDKNYIGVDIKGARLWRGAKTATQEGLRNVAFLRTRIEFITAFFGPEEVSEIWLTFSDPQLRASENKRLSSAMFLERYRSFLRRDGVIHLKTDSRFLHEYTMAVARVNSLPILACTTDLYSDVLGLGTTAGVTSLRGSTLPQDQTSDLPTEVREVKTFYETMFLEMGLPITYMEFKPFKEGPYVNPRDPEDFDTKHWREVEGTRRSFGHK
ncbi:MAG: tRNA (guanosine(46)-N7)-methyltransferase TrmB [Bacteroidales bacterium]|nr:tRNA (guanosine(46)-N7)-methyltransferase TrmB [Bacteroidales bacterium]